MPNVKAYVGVTDGDWYRFLAARPMLNEVNFWRPGGDRAFRALTAGEPFFFKTHHPHNRVVGGGFFSGFAQLRISEAWEFFGEANGVDSLEKMRAIVGRYRSQPIGAGEDPVIGCVFVRDTTFFPEAVPADPPPDFMPNVVQGKRSASEFVNQDREEIPDHPRGDVITLQEVEQRVTTEACQIA